MAPLVLTRPLFLSLLSCLSFLILRDLVSSTSGRFSRGPPLPFGKGRLQRCGTTKRGGRRSHPMQHIGRASELSTAFPIFHAAAGRSEEDRYQSLTVHYNSSCRIARERRLPADRFDVSSAVDTNLFVVPAICSRQSMPVEEISVRISCVRDVLSFRKRTPSPSSRVRPIRALREKEMLAEMTVVLGAGFFLL